MRSQFARTMIDIGVRDQNLMVLVGDIGAFGLREFAAKCPGRFYNAGIREQAIASAAAGLALAGAIPVVHSITPFVIERCYEQIKDDFGYQNLGGNFISVGAGFDYSALGCTHHSYADIALMKSIPRSQVFYPGNPQEFDELFRQNYNTGRLNYFRLGGRNHTFHWQDKKIITGEAVVAKNGEQLSIFTMGPLLEFALKAANELSEIIDVEVIYFHTIKPFDAKTVRESMRKTRNAIVVEDHHIMGGLADEVRRALDNVDFSYKFCSLGVQDVFLSEYGKFDDLAEFAGINSRHIVNNAKEMVGI